MTPVQDWPAVNGLVWLRLPCCGAEHPSRVEDFDGDDVVIAAPMAPHTDFVRVPENDQGFFIGWVMGRGAIELPVVLTKHQDQPVPLWTLKPIGPPTETQRRSYVRLELDIPVQMYLLEGGAATPARTVDISEGGLRCQVDKWALDPGPKAFTVEFDVEGKSHFLKAQCAWWGSLDERGVRIVGVRFVDVDPPVADRIRAFVFAQQILQRRRAMA